MSKSERVRSLTGKTKGTGSAEENDNATEPGGNNTRPAKKPTKIKSPRPKKNRNQYANIPKQ